MKDWHQFHLLISNLQEYTYQVTERACRAWEVESL